MVSNIIILGILLLLVGCNQTNYKAMPQQQIPDASPLERQVMYHVDREFYRDPPNCVVVLPTQGVNNPKLARQIAAALGQRLSGRVPRVIMPLERRRLSRKLAFDFNHGGDLRRFAARERCGFYARAMNGTASEAFMVVWSEKQVGFTLSLARTSDNKVLWWASHTARRGDGGVPLSPLSVLGNAAMAGKFHNDPEVIASLIDDAQRRMIRTLPDVR